MEYRVTRARVRDALRSVDPINTALRWQGGRRPYSVPGPNSLWHIGMHLVVYVLCCMLQHKYIVILTVQHKILKDAESLY